MINQFFMVEGPVPCKVEAFPRPPCPRMTVVVPGVVAVSGHAVSVAVIDGNTVVAGDSVVVAGDSVVV